MNSRTAISDGWAQTSPSAPHWRKGAGTSQAWRGVSGRDVDGDAGAREAEPEEDEQEVALDFRLLRYFIAVAEELHLARAAERLGIEQSPVSRAMRDLE